MNQPKDPAQLDGRSVIVSAAEPQLPRKPYIAPQLELLDIEATRNGPGAFPDSGGIDYS